MKNKLNMTFIFLFTLLFFQSFLMEKIRNVIPTELILSTKMAPK